MSITSSDAIFMLGVSGLFTVPQQLQGFSADDIFDTEAIEPAEIQYGLDGRISAGFVPTPVKQTVTFMADSPSVDLFDTWYTQQRAERSIFMATGIITLPSRGKVYTLINGVLTSYVPIAAAKKTLQPVAYGITWESIVGASI